MRIVVCRFCKIFLDLGGQNHFFLSSQDKQHLFVCGTSDKKILTVTIGNLSVEVTFAVNC